jgi:hypothetical protein
VVVHLIPSKKTSENKRPYHLPVRGRIEDEGPVADALRTPYPICQSALQKILGYGRRKFRSLQKAAQTNVAPTDWRRGKPPNNALKPDFEEDIHSFFCEILELAAPRATRIVQDETGAGLRDVDVELKELPTYYTKRQIYYRYCHERGHKAELKEYKGNLKYSLREHDDDKEVPLWPTGSVATKIIAWSSFRNFWARNYSNLILPNPRQDICGECFILANSFRYRKQEAADEDDGHRVVKEQDEDFEERERIIENANKHSKRSISQQ